MIWLLVSYLHLVEPLNCFKVNIKLIHFLLLQHAGEVYGERAILSTEARELQSHLLRLLDERDKSLAIIVQVLQFSFWFNPVDLELPPLKSFHSFMLPLCRHV